MLKIQAEKILQQEMDRKTFLKTTGFALIGLVGVTAAVKRLNVFGDALSKNVATTPSLQKADSHKSLAYGKAAYGV
jgi:ABC-type Mn2+/Zn2+ transport system permease subunit